MVGICPSFLYLAWRWNMGAHSVIYSSSWTRVCVLLASEEVKVAPI